MTLEEQKTEFVEDLRRERLIWSGTMVSHMGGMGIGALVLLALTVYGMYTSIGVFREKADADQLAKAISVYVGGSSSVLGFVVVGLLYRITQLTREYMRGLRRLTYFTARAKAANSFVEFNAVLTEYNS